MIRDNNSKIAQQEKIEDRESRNKKDDVTTPLSSISDAVHLKPKQKNIIYQCLRILFVAGFILFTAVFLNEVMITPYRINKSIEHTKSLYNNPASTVSETVPTLATSKGTQESAGQQSNITKVTPVPVSIDPNRDENGRLLQFQDLLKGNEDVKGWITIPDTNIDYVVLQSDEEDPEYYLTRDMEKKELKAGSLFLDYKSSVETNTQNIVIHGHNMTSSDNMFHYLINFKELDYYKARPVFTFDTIYQTGQWKIFAIIITNGTSTKEPLFDYTRAEFKDTSDFLNFVYQLRIRSIYHMDTVDVNENDQLLTLSTCSYEVKNYRTVIIARRVREGEEATVAVDRVTVNLQPLYPESWYYRYGGKAPTFTETFEEALDKGEIKWYFPTETK
jgi:sortase B